MNDGIYHVIKAVPESVKIELGAIATRHRRDYWQIGDITNQIIQTIRERPDIYPDVGEMEVYKAVAIMLEQEYSVRTVRDYASIARFFGVEYRQDYDLLPFSHFRFARSFGARCIEILDYSLAITHEQDRPPSVEFLEMKFNPQPGIPEENPPEYDRVYQDETGGIVAQEITVHKALVVLRQGVRVLKLQEPIKSLVESLLDELEMALQPLLDKSCVNG